MFFPTEGRLALMATPFRIRVVSNFSNPQGIQ